MATMIVTLVLLTSLFFFSTWASWLLFQHSYPELLVCLNLLLVDCCVTTNKGETTKQCCISVLLEVISLEHGFQRLGHPSLGLVLPENDCRRSDNLPLGLGFTKQPHLGLFAHCQGWSQLNISFEGYPTTA